MLAMLMIPVRIEAEQLWHGSRRSHQRGKDVSIDAALDELRGELDKLAQEQIKDIENAVNEADESLYQDMETFEDVREVAAAERDTLGEDIENDLEDTAAVMEAEQKLALLTVDEGDAKGKKGSVRFTK
jgi:hypothetical protein